MSHPSNFFARGRHLSQSKSNPEGICLAMCVFITRKSQGNAGELELDRGSHGVAAEIAKGQNP